ncbi:MULTISPECIES: hypothetical protein [Glycomyces]|uniref:Uncharacterized protein n=2 Tax=Glycomyces TaxID=58113 RepID=A0A9X3SWU4_9ACTN|nr:hypothetical protein [Glycomyces lechevalierae]MDA1384391.1 hypothetical protein [Glycomyces lechevalierae]MDR7339175.1 hypothetical protein [Glycomyces lechevalierae]
MIPDRYTTRRIRARYIQALQAIPLPVRRADPPDAFLPIDLAGLPVLATEAIGERLVQYSLVVGQTRFRLTFIDTHPALIGHVINLETPSPRLVIAEPFHTEWALTNELALAAHATRIWKDHTRTCNR